MENKKREINVEIALDEAIRQVGDLTREVILLKTYIRQLENKIKEFESNREEEGGGK